MGEYIEREALETDLNHRLNFLMAENGEYDHYTSGFDEAVTRVENFPAADVAPVVQGEWKTYTVSACQGSDDLGNPICRDAVVFRCSECNRRTVIKEHFCPSCGARMDGSGEDERVDQR